MINTKKVLLVIFAILIPTITAISSIYLIKREEGEVKGVAGVVNDCTPYITNMMPNLAHMNEEYYFYPKVVGCNIEDVEIEIRGVDWLEIVDGNYIYGIPTKFDLGIHRVILEVKSLSNSSRYVEYITVEENER